MSRCYSIVVLMINIIVAKRMLFFDIIGSTSNLFKNPNFLSKIRGKPVFKDPVKHVKIKIPQFKNVL